MKKAIHFLIFMMAITSGCVTVDSSNRSVVINTTEKPVTVSQAPPVVITSKVVETTGNKSNNPAQEATYKKCPIYVPTEIPTVKPAPLAKFSELPMSKQQEREAILLEYIKDLRTHIAAARKAHSDNYKTYITKCSE